MFMQFLLIFDLLFFSYTVAINNVSNSTLKENQMLLQFNQMCQNPFGLIRTNMIQPNKLDGSTSFTNSADSSVDNGSASIRKDIQPNEAALITSFTQSAYISPVNGSAGKLILDQNSIVNIIFI